MVCVRLLQGFCWSSASGSIFCWWCGRWNRNNFGSVRNAIGTLLHSQCLSEDREYQLDCRLWSKSLSCDMSYLQAVIKKTFFQIIEIKYRYSMWKYVLISTMYQYFWGTIRASLSSSSLCRYTCFPGYSIQANMVFPYCLLEMLSLGRCI